MKEILLDERADFEVVLTDGTRGFISYKTRNLFERTEIILGERNISTEYWEDHVELIDFLNARDQGNSQPA